jgi:N-acetyl-alpha-D-muramate 1-phosphate uridylyltransferase
MTWKPQTAMVLAAGLGTRMRPLNESIPKPLVPLKSVPLLDRVLDRIADAGITRAVVNVHYKADQIEQHVKRRERPKIVVSDERGVLLETGGGVRKALPLLGTEPFLVHNSDSVWIEGVGSNLDRLFAAWDAQSMDCLLLLSLGSASIGYTGQGDFSLDSEGRIRRRRDGEVVPFVAVGVYIVHPRVFADTPSTPFSMNLIWNRAILAGRAFGVRMEGIWMHVGTPDAVAEAEAALDGRHDWTR